MIIVMGEIEVEDGAIDGVKDALAGMEKATRDEAGSLTYAFATDISSPTTIRIIERWESMAALEEHFGSPHMAAFGEALGGLKPISMDIKCYEIAGEVKLPG
jgi:quinol monooxygenase YgiN